MQCNSPAVGYKATGWLHLIDCIGTLDVSRFDDLVDDTSPLFGEKQQWQKAWGVKTSMQRIFWEYMIYKYIYR